MTDATVIPWVEKYRPTRFEDIVMDETNRKFFTKVLETDYFPNMLFYGPPGTGKTTTIVNLISAYKSSRPERLCSSVIHLNASDDRGIDVIRNQIYQFATACGMFGDGPKFVILDEVDYMTKTAQQALKYLVQTCRKNVKFCLICNYITKIDETLRNEFVCIRFNQLPELGATAYLTRVAAAEQLSISTHEIEMIQERFQSDLRCMINFMQQSFSTAMHFSVLCDDVFEDLHMRFCSPLNFEVGNTTIHIRKMCAMYNIDPKSFIHRYFNYVIRTKPELITRTFLHIVSIIVHTPSIDITYFCTFLRKHFVI